ncbi:MAG: prepilin peptidase [Gammaproteobacteria bacterium]|nr:prepilin peptidase [Gammaproteobacteria bacterium]
MLPFADNPALFTLLLAGLGLAIGSFLNVVIHRLPIMLERGWRRDCESYLKLPQTAPTAEPYNLILPPSACPKCGHRIAAWQNIPIVSYLLLRGRCGSCQAPISPRYPLLELLSGLAGAVAAWHFGPGAAAIGAAVLSWALLALAVIDLDHQLLPDCITLPLLWLGITFNCWETFVPLQTSVAGAMVGYLSLWAVYWSFKLLTGKEGMAAGDFKLLAMLGAWLGWRQLLPIILISSAVGALVGIALILWKQHKRDVPIPFGPYLAVAGWIALLWGPHLLDAWLGPGPRL